MACLSPELSSWYVLTRLLLVMFGLGEGSLVSMALLTGEMVAEKTFRVVSVSVPS
jgi:hypothetical protein